MSDGDEPEIGARCLKVCREVIWNADDPDAPYTLRGVVQRFRPPPGYPAIYRRPVYLYVEYFGGSEECEIWFDLVRFVSDDDGEAVDEIELASFGPFVFNPDPGRFVQGRSYVVRSLPLPEPGVYELRLRIGGVGMPLITERLFAEDLS